MKFANGYGWIVTGMLAGFLVGVFAHSLAPSLAVDGRIIAAAAVLLAFGFSAMESTFPRLLLCVLAAVLLGVWRFESVRLTMSPGLIPFDPKGLAFVREEGVPANPWDPRHWLGQTRRVFSDTAAKEFPPNEAALLTGMLYGERNLPKAVKEDFRRAGLLHLIAVSGSNVTWIASLVMGACLWLGLRRRRAFAAVTVVLVAFVLFVSPSASVVRAAMMGWLVLLAPLVGRIPRPSRLLLLSAVAFVAWKPWALLFDPGFALSFLAMWGLLSWAPVFSRSLESRIPWSAPREILAATLGTTLMTMPYAAWAFGQVSWFGLVSNVLVLPLVPWIMLLGALALALPWLGWFTWATQGLLTAVLWIANVAERFPSTGGKVSTSVLGCIAWYVVFLLIWIYFFNEKRVFHNAEGKRMGEPEFV